jgi:AcrR family transcriptional regulator
MPRVLTETEVAAFRKALCAVATRRFAEKGYAGVTLRALAAELGCSPMTPYRYFASKESIFDAVRVAAFSAFADYVAGVPRPEDPRERLHVLNRAYVRYALDHPDGYRIMFELAQPQAPSPELTKEIRRGWQHFSDAIDEAIRAGVLEGDPDLLTHLLWVPMHGAITLHLSGKLVMGVDLDRLGEPVVESLLRWAAPAARSSP